MMGVNHWVGHTTGMPSGFILPVLKHTFAVLVWSKVDIATVYDQNCNLPEADSPDITTGPVTKSVQAGSPFDNR